MRKMMLRDNPLSSRIRYVRQQHIRLGTPICRSGQSNYWSLLCLAGVVTATAIAISSNLWGKGISFFNEKINGDGTSKGNDEREDGGTKEDRISELPDDLLSNIMSRLSLVDAVRMRILSRRWRTVFVHSSRLSFDCLNMFFHCDGMLVREKHAGTKKRVRRRFFKAIDQTLRLYAGHKLTSVQIKCCLGKECFPYLGQWMQSFASLGVEELDLQFHCRGGVRVVSVEAELLSFPFQLLFQVVTLKHLYLFQCVLPPISNGQLNSLELLSLFHISLDKGALTSICCSCPNLSSLILFCCKLGPESCISGPCGLKFLRISFCVWAKVIDIKLMNLTTFEFFNNGYPGYKLSFVPKLQNLYVRNRGSGTVSYIFGEVSKACPDLKSLTFETETDEVPYLPGRMNMFTRLRHLDLLMRVGSRMNLHHVTPIFFSCPLLQKLNLLTEYTTRHEQSFGVWPSLCHAHLMEVNFDGFCGTRNEMEFTLFLLRSAPKLHRIKIQTSIKIFFSTREFIHRELGRKHLAKMFVS